MSKKIIFTDRSDSLLNSYLREISKYKILDSSEINELIKKAQAGDINARDKVVNANLRFVVTVAKQFQGRGIPLMDLISSGNIGLVTSVEKFDPERGITFLGYAVWWIKQSIFKLIYWHGKAIRLPMSQQLLVNTITDATDKFLKEHHRTPTSVELSELTDIPVEQIDFLSQFSNKLVSVDEFIGGDEDNSQICDIIPDGEPLLDEQLNKKYLSEEIEKILNCLTIREHDLLCATYGIGMNKIAPKKLQSMFGITNERLRQMREIALNKIRKKFGNKLKSLL